MNVKQFQNALEITLEVAMTMEHPDFHTEAEREAARCKVFAHAISYSLRDIDPALSKKLRALRTEDFWRSFPSGE